MPMNSKQGDGLLHMHQKMSIDQQAGRVALNDEVGTEVVGKAHKSTLSVLANDRKSRFDVKEEAGTSGEKAAEGEDKPKRRKRRSRWAGEDQDKVVVPGMSTNVPTGLNPLQQKLYVLQLQVEDCTRRLPGGFLLFFLLDFWLKFPLTRHLKIIFKPSFLLMYRQLRDSRRP